MRRGHAVVVASLVPPVVVEVYGIRHPGQGFTLSELIRWGYRTHTGVGRVAFVASVAAGVVWLVPHIVRKAAESAT